MRAPPELCVAPPPESLVATLLALSLASAINSAFSSSLIGHTGGGLFGGGGVLSSLGAVAVFFGDCCITSCSGLDGSSSLLFVGSLEGFLSIR